MKKLVIGILSTAFILGAGTFTYAQVTNEGKAPTNFGQMKPIMEKMHPDLSVKELKEMYQSCQENGGMMQDVNMENMMNGTNMMN